MVDGHSDVQDAMVPPSGVRGIPEKNIAINILKNLFMTEKKTMSLLERLKNKAKTQEHYGGRLEEKPAEMIIRDCPNCGAGRAWHDGITHCAYCGFAFIRVKITDGLNLKKEDNSR